LPCSMDLNSVNARKLRYILSVTSGNENLPKSLCLLMTLASDTYFKKGVNIHVFIEHMKKIFILTDLMYSGQHREMEWFIQSAGFSNINFTYEPTYWNLHKYEWDSYDELFCIIDHLDGHEDNPEFVEQLHKRMELLKQNGFKFILARPWESAENVANSKFYDLLKNFDYTRWFGGTSWFWYWMRSKHMNDYPTSIEGGKQENILVKCDHTNKKFDYLYLNKQPRRHRVKLWAALHDKKLLDKSLITFIGLKPSIRLDPAYELPWVDTKNYPMHGMDQEFYVKPYEHSACSIISETNDNEDIFITEKLWKPILCQHFFIVHGNYLYLQKIRELGFRTFGQYFDESYDLEADPVKRIEKITTLIESLKGFDWKDAYLSSQKLRKHNHDLFWSDFAYQKEVKKSVNKFLGFE